VGCRVAGAEETTTGSNVASGELTTVSGFGEVEVEAAQTATAKKVIESTVRESHFSKEDVDALKSEIENLKTELASMKNVEVNEVVELSAQPLTHNPDAKLNVEKVLFSQNRVMTTFDRVMNKIAN
jgi:formyltetrahydrofolate synthetase